MTYRLIAILILLALTFGALNVTPAYAVTITVTSSDDSGIGTLRQAIVAAAANDTITFAGDTTITLASTLIIDKSLTIDGAGHKITISGDKNSSGVADPGDVRVFYINSGISANLNNLTIINGYASDSGAGIVNLGTLNVTNSTLSNNLLIISDGVGGAGIHNKGTGTLNVTNSTFTGNNAGNASGGAILNDGTLTVINSTFSGNITSGSGGGVRNSGTAMLKNTILANSTGDNCSKTDIGTITDGGGNLEDGVTCGFSAVTSKSNTEPKLGAFDYYGGLTKTFPLQPGSAAIDAGVSATCAAAPVSGLDQRGVTRPSGKCDIGAYEKGIYYVKPAASGAGNCQSWANACMLQDALTTAQSGDEVWVAAGIYTPGAVESATFQLKNGVAIYGGFAGNEVSGFNLDSRNFSTNKTTLSGKLGAAKYSTHIVTGPMQGSSAILDGFTIADGKAAGNTLETACGGGLYIYGGSPTLSNLIFKDNAAVTYIGTPDIGGWGGGMYNVSGSPTLSNVAFSSNTARSGGGMFNVSGSPKLTNVTFSGNIASGPSAFGGGMYIESGSPTLSNVTFSGNIAEFGGYGGGMHNFGTPTLINVTFNKNTAGRGGGMTHLGGQSVITNTIFWGNTGTSEPEIYINPFSPPTISYSVVQGGYAGTGNITADPLLGTLGDNGGLTQTVPIQAGSSAIDAGDVTKCPATDQRGESRVGACDIGAYEYTPGGGGGRIIVRPWVIIASDGLYAERVRVDWTATTGASYYLVYRSESLDGPKLPIGGVRTTSLGGDDLWALPGVTYYYWVRACTESGCGEFYTYNYDSGWQGLAAPLISASNGTFPDKVQVSWPAVPGANSYLGFRAESLAGTQIPANGYLTSLPGGDDLWALPGVTYFYWVKACNGLNCGPLSAVETGWR